MYMHVAFEMLNMHVKRCDVRLLYSNRYLEEEKSTSLSLSPYSLCKGAISQARQLHRANDIR